MADIRDNDPSRFEKYRGHHGGDVENPLEAMNGDHGESDQTKSQLDNDIILGNHETRENHLKSSEQDKVAPIGNKMWREKIRVREREEKKKRILEVSSIMLNNTKKKFVREKSL